MAAGAIPRDNTVLKVAYDHQIFASQQFGGVSRYFVELAKRVARAKGCSAEVVAPLHFNDLLRDSGVPVRGFYIHPTPRTTGRHMRAGNDLLIRPYLWAVAPQVLHQTYYPRTPYRLSRTAVVVTVYDMIHERYADLFNPADDTRKRKRAAVQHADTVICISEHTRRDLVEILGVPEERTRVVHVGFALQRASGDRALPAPLTERYLLFVGERAGYKNFSRLLEAYAASSRLRAEFVLVACGRHPFSPGELALMRQIGLDAGRVRHMSGGDEFLASLYAHATALVYPSLYEGFGLPPLEAMSHDCPVVCSNTSSIPEVVGDAAVLFDPADVESLRDALERVAFSDATRAALIARGRERLKRFSWERCAAQTVAIYREVCGR